MQYEDMTTARRAAMLVALLAGGAVVTQAGLNATAAMVKGTSPMLAVASLFGYFTIWSNTLVAAIAARYAARGAGGGLLTRPGTMAAAAVYIVVVGVIYNKLLARYNPVTGLRLVVDTVLHSVVPLAYALWWLVLVPRVQLAWRALWPALAFPFAYCIVALTRGLSTGKYAYFFIDIGKYGAVQVAMNILGLVMFFAGLMALVIAFDRWAHRRGMVSASAG
ncbi:Pr6Pr family membrane protein [Sandarakinorhabdus sp. DWP1-3-1]|uniref:Pr6Pr family membrane protein n=1 Tax=Sandarakinorhabdus sp. DWP1-3-1 TaxID=2804627 RepID=UPI003CE964A3